MGPNARPQRGVKALGGGIVAVCAAALVLSALPAGAHGDVEDSSPAAGSTVRRAPERVSLDLAEPPAEGSSLLVRDGCNREVSDGPRIDGDRISVPVSEGQPGRWRVRVRSISSVDGHLVRENLSFRVRGEKDCSAEETPGEDDSPDDEVELGVPQPPLQNDEAASFPIVWFAVGTALVVAIAIALRRPGRKS